MKKENKAIQIQSKYYAETAKNYDDLHVISHHDFEHEVSLNLLSSFINLYNIKSILDVGAGTGRTIQYILENHPEVKIVGIEPVKELREIAYKVKEIPKEILIDGNGNQISFEENSFDLVCEFGVLHHVAHPARVIDQMFKVARLGIFISDSNNFGQGSFIKRSLKQGLNFFGLWRFYNYVSTGGRIYKFSEGDGIYYSYSVFDNYKQIKKYCKIVHLTNTIDGQKNLYRTASHLCLFGLKK